MHLRKNVANYEKYKNYNVEHTVVGELRNKYCKELEQVHLLS